MLLLAAMAWLVSSGAVVTAAEYRIGPEDVLEIKFWQDPTLNSIVRVRLDGKISLDIVGEIDAAGRTTQDLQTDIVRQMSRLNKRISQAVVQVKEYNYQHVFVYGQVNRPGKLTFEAIPDLLAVLNEAGWVTEKGDLSRVSIIRGGDQAGEVEVVDVAAVVAAGQVDRLPRLNRQDAVDVPAAPEGMTPTDIGQMAARRNVIYIMGAVKTPGPIAFQENMDIMEVLAMAGGHSETADLRRTVVVRKDGYYGQSLRIDLEKYAETGVPARHVMHKEDICVVPFRREGWFSRNIGSIVTVLGAATSAVLLYENLKPKDQ